MMCVCVLACVMLVSQTHNVALMLMLAPLTDTHRVSHRHIACGDVCVCSCVCYFHLTDTPRGARARASMPHRHILCVMMCVSSLVCVIIIL